MVDVVRPHLHDCNRTDTCWCGAAPGELHTIFNARWLHLRQHIPAFVNDGEGGWLVDAPDLASLLALPQVAIYAKDVEPVERRGKVTGWVNGVPKTVEVIHPAPEAQRFYRWSLSRDTMMVEHNNGDRFKVVGFITADDPAALAALPAWQETETARLRREAWNRGDTGPVPPPYRCAEHGVAWATCCLPRCARS